MDPIELQDSAESAEFFSNLSVLTVLMLFVLSLVGFSKLYLHRHLIHIRKMNNTQPSFEYEAENTLNFWTCIMAVSVGLGAVFLVPISILSEAANRCMHDAWITTLVTPDVVAVLWKGFFFTSNLMHYIVVPFAYLYIEAQGFGRRQSVLWRCLETSVSLLCVLLLTAVFLYMIRHIFGFEQLTFSYLLSSFVGSFFFLLFLPFGLRRTVRAACNLYIPLGQNSDTFREKIALLEVQIEATKVAIQRRGNGDTDPREERENLSRLQSELKRAQYLIKTSPWAQRVVAVLSLLFSLAFTLLVLVRMITHQLNPSSSSVVVVDSRSNSVTWEILVTAVDIVLILFLWAATISGKRDFPLSIKRRNVDERDSMLLHAAAMLLMGSSLPLVAWNLGLTNFHGAKWENDVAFFQNNYVGSTFNVLFLFALVWVIFTEVNGIKEMTKDIKQRIKHE